MLFPDLVLPPVAACGKVEVDLGGGVVLRLKRAELARVAAPSQGQAKGAAFLAEKAAAAARRSGPDKRKAFGAAAGISKRTRAILESVGEAASGATSAGRQGGAPQVASELNMRTSTNTVDCLGCTVDEAARRIDQVARARTPSLTLCSCATALCPVPMTASSPRLIASLRLHTPIRKRFNEALLRGNKRLYLLHGHGTGALKQGLRNWLKTSKGAVVKSFKAASIADGGDAFTVVELR